MEHHLILLVEDDPGDEALALRALQKNGVRDEIVVVRDGAEALDFLFALGVHGGRDRERLPTVVLLDLKLPKVDGLEVLRQVRAHPLTELLPVVMLTSSSEEQDIRSSYRLGANSFVRKPVNFDQFIAAIGQLHAYWLSLNERPPLTRSTP